MRCGCGAVCGSHIFPGLAGPKADEGTASGTVHKKFTGSAVVHTCTTVCVYMHNSCACYEQAVHGYEQQLCMLCTSCAWLWATVVHVMSKLCMAMSNCVCIKMLCMIKHV